MIVRNCSPEVEITSVPDPSKLTVYALGNLREDRGVGLLLDAVELAGDCRVIAAGKCRDERLATRLAASPLVDYRGVLPQDEALELCGAVDVVLTFYAPGLEINRRAVSNKWSDAMMAARPILVNAEVDKATWVQEQGIGYACAYDRDELVRTLDRIASNRADAAARGARGRKLWEAGYRWDEMEERIVEVIEHAARRGAPR